ncbi:hypothetical protein DLG24_21575 [Salmonella enterica]|nr:hypothetical protein [Salmonella enterica subsp. enterica serovar 4,12:i:-]EGX5363813.1 hypothetical protein [Salmonella enterica]
MLGWVISCHDDRAQEMLEGLEKKYGPLAQCRAVNFWRGLSVNIYSLMEEMITWRESMSSSAFRDQIVALGAPDVTSLWHQQQKNPPFVLLHDSYEF